MTWQGAAVELVERVALERQRRGAESQRTAATLGGISNQTWATFEATGVVTPKVRAGIAAAFGWPTDWPENPPAVSPVDDDALRRVAQLERVVVATGRVVEVLGQDALEDGLEELSELLDELRSSLRAVQ